ncbi:DUF2235 domain-containing protein [Dyella terrae]|uniref:DUF2235 domain-containing protein n=1 Tax=Dyella terrae TaxID=522259 RepID=UPI001EFD0694|nr:DUF2235 domain-containing protein [Dyella terrae]
MDLKIGMHPLGATPGIVHVFPSRIPRTEHCEVPLNIAVFMDGTGNNKDDDEGGKAGSQLVRRKQSNVARLHAAFPDKPEQGYYRIYVEGLGTPCRAIGENTATALGNAAGQGGEGRIHLALLQLLNTVVRAASPGQLATVFDEKTIKALCRNGSRGLSPGLADVRTSNPSLIVPGLGPAVHEEWSPYAGPDDEDALRGGEALHGGRFADGWPEHEPRAGDQFLSGTDAPHRADDCALAAAQAGRDFARGVRVFARLRASARVRSMAVRAGRERHAVWLAVDDSLCGLV